MACALVEVIGAGAAHQSVRGFAAVEAIAAAAAGEPIGPISAAQGISALVAVEHVVLARTGELVIAVQTPEVVPIASSAKDVAPCIANGDLIVVPLAAGTEVKRKSIGGHVLTGQVLERRIPPIMGKLV